MWYRSRDMDMGHRYYIAFGANLGDTEETFRRALEEVGKRIAPVDRVSKLYRTAPLNPPELQESSQPEFLNAAFSFVSGGEPLAVLDELLAIEKLFGRDRSQTVRWGPRTIDLDILLVGDLTINQPRLVVPHSEMHKRDFVLRPLADIGANERHPVLRRSIVELLQHLERGTGGESALV